MFSILNTGKFSGKMLSTGLLFRDSGLFKSISESDNRGINEREWTKQLATFLQKWIGWGAKNTGLGYRLAASVCVKHNLKKKQKSKQETEFFSIQVLAWNTSWCLSRKHYLWNLTLWG